jgi:hypothetical protein
VDATKDYSNPSSNEMKPDSVEGTTTTMKIVTVASHPSLESELQQSERLGFVAQARLVREGFRKGVKYDGCTAVPDFDFGADCCGEHDYHYQIGDVSRWQADKNMRKCIRQKGYVILPWAYWLGVRIFAGGVWKRYRNEEIDTRSFDSPA